MKDQIKIVIKQTQFFLQNTKIVNHKIWAPILNAYFMLCYITMKLITGNKIIFTSCFIVTQNYNSYGNIYLPNFMPTIEKIWMRETDIGT